MDSDIIDQLLLDIDGLHCEMMALNAMQVKKEFLETYFFIIFGLVIVGWVKSGGAKRLRATTHIFHHMDILLVAYVYFFSCIPHAKPSCFSCAS